MMAQVQRKERSTEFFKKVTLLGSTEEVDDMELSEIESQHSALWQFVSHDRIVIGYQTESTLFFRHFEA